MTAPLAPAAIGIVPYPALPELPWVPNTTPIAVRLILKAAQQSVGYCESPPGSNRGDEIDAINRRAGVPLGSYWCAAWAGAMWRAAGLEVPAGYASCDRWMAWARATGRWTAHVPSLGAVVLYGVPGDARHCGIVMRVTPLVMTLEGNTTLLPGYDRNGIAVATKEITEHSPVLGYVHPDPLPVSDAVPRSA